MADCSAYADDTLVLVSTVAWQEAEEIMNSHLNKIYNWLALNQLSLNLAKSVYIAFGCYTDSVPKGKDLQISKLITIFILV